MHLYNFKCKTMLEMWFLLREGGGGAGWGHYIMFVVIGQPNGPLQKKIQNICVLGCTTIN
jgi:hypothetical protein